ncbi:MAG: response regulator [Acidobacteriota bacterium]
MTPSPTILLVDDYADALEVWELYLRSSGFTVATATNGRDALAYIAATPPDLAVLDLQLDRMSGCDIARALRADQVTRTLPLIAATGHSHSDMIEEATTAGFDVVLVKPCDPDRLVDEIRRLLASR